jgi:hypothetical protein
LPQRLKRVFGIDIKTGAAGRADALFAGDWTAERMRAALYTSYALSKKMFFNFWRRKKAVSRKR